jgi:hypothetical protein
MVWETVTVAPGCFHLHGDEAGHHALKGSDLEDPGEQDGRAD